MSAGLGILAAALHQATSPPKDETWDTMGDDLRSPWIAHAETVRDLMAEADGDNRELTILDTLALTTGAAKLADEALGRGALTDLDQGETLELLRQLRSAVTILGRLDNLLTNHAYVVGEHGHQAVEGLGPVWIGRSRDRRKWDERGVIQAVLDEQLARRDGEVPMDPWQIVEWVLEVCAVDRVRVTAMRSLGLNPDDFCESKVGRPSVTLPPEPDR